MSNGPCCAHRRIAYVEVYHGDRTQSNRWECSDCRQHFAPIATRPEQLVKPPVLGDNWIGKIHKREDNLSGYWKRTLDCWATRSQWRGEVRTLLCICIGWAVALIIGVWTDWSIFGPILGFCATYLAMSATSNQP